MEGSVNCIKKGFWSDIDKRLEQLDPYFLNSLFEYRYTSLIYGKGVSQSMNWISAADFVYAMRESCTLRFI